MKTSVHKIQRTPIKCARIFMALFFLSLIAFSFDAGANTCRQLLDQLRPAPAPAVRTENRNEVMLSERQITDELAAQDKALWRINLQHFYEGAIQFLQKRVTVSSVRSTLAQERSRRLNLMHFLSQGKHNETIDIYRKLFDDVELSYWIIKNTQQQLRQENLPLENKIQLEKRLFLRKRLFAQKYGEYISVRNYLESINENSQASALFIESAQKTLRYLGVHKFSEVYPDFQALRIPEQRVSLADIKTLYRSESQYTRLKLVADFRNEIFSALRYLVSAEILVSTVDRVISRFPPHAADKLKNLVGLMRSAQLRHRTLPQIIEIESLPHDLNMRLTELRKKNSLSNNDELLVTYARTVEFTESFNEIKTHAALRANEPDNVIMKQFYQRLLEAEQRAGRLPDISLYEKMSNIDVMYTLVQAGIIIKVTAPQVFNSTSDFFTFLLNFGL